jgi:osmotically inducible protein OsmC
MSIMDIYRKASAEWKGTLKEGSGTMKAGSGTFDGPYNWASRFADGPLINPEELIGAASAGCFSMFLSALLTKEGFNPTFIRTEAKVNLVDGPTIRSIELNCQASVPGLDQSTFNQKVEEAKKACPVSKALASVDISLKAELV